MNYNCNGNWRKVVAFFGTKRLWHGPARAIRNDPRAVPRDRQCAQRPPGAAHLAAKANDPPCPAVSTSGAGVNRICRPRLQNLPPGTFLGLEGGKGCGNYRKLRRGGFSSSLAPFLFCMPFCAALLRGARRRSAFLGAAYPPYAGAPFGALRFLFPSDECSPKGCSMFSPKRSRSKRRKLSTGLVCVKYS